MIYVLYINISVPLAFECEELVYYLTLRPVPTPWCHLLAQCPFLQIQKYILTFSHQNLSKHIELMHHHQIVVQTNAAQYLIGTLENKKSIEIATQSSEKNVA